MDQLFRLNVNGATLEVTCEGETPLLYVLRNDLALNGPKFGCGLGPCGACMVQVAGDPVRSCQLPVGAVGDSPILTLDGLAGGDTLHPLQEAFLAEQAAQCAYCTNGMIMTAKALLERERAPREDDVRAAIAGVLCRCGTHDRIVAPLVLEGAIDGPTFLAWVEQFLAPT
ncbi:MAG: (2Fe-2S)-binding protein, partial [Solirubrobacterales bacterium]|nr:(2Fe-2S)-binding protein [Solirubrobacterales bacterium]